MGIYGIHIYTTSPFILISQYEEFYIYRIALNINESK